MRHNANTRRKLTRIARQALTISRQIEQGDFLDATALIRIMMFLHLDCLRLERRCNQELGLITAHNTGAATTLVGAVNEIREEAGWFLIAPYGEWPNEVGLQVFGQAQAEEMVRDFRSVEARAANHFRGVPIYVGHPDAGEPDPRYGGARFGAFRELEARNTGLWGRPKMRKEGQELLDDGAFQYLSARWDMAAINNRPGAYHPVVLVSVGLTNFPNIPGLPIGAANQHQTTAMFTAVQLAQLRKYLGLPDDATVDIILTAANTAGLAVGSLTTATNAKATVDGELATAKHSITSLTTQVTAANTRISTLEEEVKAERKARVDLVLTNAVNTGRITEAQRPDWAGKLTADLPKHEAELGTLKPALSTVSRTQRMGDRRGVVVGSGAASITAINSAVAAKQKEGGLDYATAYQLVQADPAHKALFETPVEED